MNGMKRQKDMTLEDEPPGLEGVQYATWEEQRANTLKAHSQVVQPIPGVYICVWLPTRLKIKREIIAGGLVLFDFY